jgi:hypothetical protein
MWVERNPSILEYIGKEKRKLLFGLFVIAAVVNVVYARMQHVSTSCSVHSGAFSLILLFFFLTSCLVCVESILPYVGPRDSAPHHHKKETLPHMKRLVLLVVVLLTLITTYHVHSFFRQHNLIDYNTAIQLH